MSIAGILITNNGPHSADKWAVLTVSQLIKIAQGGAGASVSEGRKLELKILELLEQFHAEIQQKERGKLASKGYARLQENIDPEFEDDIDLEAMTDAIVEVALFTPFEMHFQKAGTKEHIRGVLRSHFATSMDVERSWHVDNATDPNSPEVLAYREARNKHYNQE